MQKRQLCFYAQEFSSFLEAETCSFQAGGACLCWCPVSGSCKQTRRRNIVYGALQACSSIPPSPVTLFSRAVVLCSTYMFHVSYRYWGEVKAMFISLCKRGRASLWMGQVSHSTNSPSFPPSLLPSLPSFHYHLSPLYHLSPPLPLAITFHFIG